jgi:hypothetical protein
MFSSVEAENGNNGDGGGHAVTFGERLSFESAVSSCFKRFGGREDSDFELHALLDCEPELEDWFILSLGRVLSEDIVGVSSRFEHARSRNFSTSFTVAVSY